MLNFQNFRYFLENIDLWLAFKNSFGAFLSISNLDGPSTFILVLNILCT